MNVEEKIELIRFKLDKTGHIKLNKEICKDCKIKPCLYVCPAKNYKSDEGELIFDWAACLECGACRIVCSTLGKGAVDWNYPRGGFGVCFRYG